MNKHQFISLLENTYKGLLELTATKGEEYSRDVDQLANFKRQSIELGITPEQVLQVYLNKHLDSIKSYIKTKKVLSEPIEGRIDDAILYLILLKGLLEDGRNQSNPPTGRTLSGGIHPTIRPAQDLDSARVQTTDTRPQFELK